MIPDIEVICRACGQDFRAAGIAAGKSVRCPGCRAAIGLPEGWPHQGVPIGSLIATTAPPRLG